MEDSLFEDDWGIAPSDDPGADDDARAPAAEAAIVDGGRTEEALLALARLASAALSGDDAAVHDLLDGTSAALANAQPPFALQFVDGLAFRDRGLVPVGGAGLGAGRALATFLGSAGAAVLTVHGAPGSEDLQAFAAASLAAHNGQPAALLTLATGAISCSPAPAARRGGDPRQTDAELFAATQVARAEAAVAAIAAAPGQWPWAQGVDVIRRLDRCLTVNSGASIRAMEISDQPWTPARVAVATVGQCLLVLGSLRVAPDVRRAVAHGLLNLCVSGIQGDRPGGFCATATRCLPRLLRPWAPSGHDEAMSGPPPLTPHHLRVCGLLDAIAQAGEPTACKGVARLLCLLYGMAGERQRHDGTGRSLADLLAMAAADMKPGYDMPWLNAVTRANNGLPVGTGVQLADGRFGVVMAPGRSGDPLQPLVQVGEQVVAAQAAVRPVPAG